MKAAERRRLESRGWKVGDADELLGLTPEEFAVIDLKITLVAFLREQRQRAGLTQAELARRIGSSQPRVAKMEGFDHEATIDLILRALFACGISVQGVGKLLEGTGKKRKTSLEDAGRKKRTEKPQRATRPSSTSRKSA